VNLPGAGIFGLTKLKESDYSSIIATYKGDIVQKFDNYGAMEYWVRDTKHSNTQRVFLAKILLAFNVGKGPNFIGKYAILFFSYNKPFRIF
jgi:hypothetical protein